MLAVRRSWFARYARLPLSIQMPVDCALRLSGRIGGDDNLEVLLLHLLHQRLCIIRLSPSNIRILKVAQQRWRQLHLMGLSFREREANCVSECVDDGIGSWWRDLRASAQWPFPLSSGARCVLMRPHARGVDG